jgi:hypothetical protein
MLMATSSSPLASDETYMKRYSDLSRGGKQQLDLDRRERLKAAQSAAKKGDSIGTRASDIASKALLASPFNARSRSDIGDVNARAERREDSRKEALGTAQDEANYKDINQEDANTGIAGKRRYFADTTPSKMYAKGGSVRSASQRADGCAQRGKTRA